MTAQVIVALATLAAGIVALILYVRKQQDSPEALYRRAVDEYNELLAKQKGILDELAAELAKNQPSGDRVRDLSDTCRLVAGQLSDARRELDRLRPRG